MRRCGIGIDTGGTYTDAVLMECETGRVLAKAKTPTTHNDLGEGLGIALERLVATPGFATDALSVVAVSSTLATNAVVENRGADVALFVIGLDRHFELPVAGIQTVSGGHTVTGDEVEPLGLESLMDGVQLFKRGRVDSYAVISAMSFANPTHEKVAQKAITLIDDKPVFLSHEVSARPGMEERAATTVLNARLMPVMSRFLEGVGTALSEHGILREARVVRGDGTATGMESAIREAARTVASGPAATAFFGASAVTSESALVVDVGGTTTDITLIEGGRPTVEEDGSLIGEHRTHVPAVDMSTVGCGGDSCVRLTRDGITVGPDRVAPMALEEVPLDLPDHAVSLVRKVAGRPATTAVGEALEDGIQSPACLARRLGISEMAVSDVLDDAIRKGEVVAIGFTPTATPFTS